MSTIWGTVQVTILDLIFLYGIFLVPFSSIRSIAYFLIISDIKTGFNVNNHLRQRNDTP